MASLVIKTFVVIFLLLLMNMSSGRVEGFGGVKPAFPTNEKGPIQEKKIRKLIIALNDYGKAEPNPKHDKKPGGSKR
ncbi:hypothetical protein L484_007824 [Morus notabilis]|uniref:Uncharacterized protein n=1 Tax=Morus notabilis TaxID=981085 RepID=W9RWJ4_9ROSA|nr:hypothetical protein L484_007824 [Morus notabilis]